MTTPMAPAWHVLIETARGAAHERSGLPLQDAAGYAGDPDEPGGVLALAVADGHGSRRHPRSHDGAEFAIEAALAVGREFGYRFTGLGTAEEAGTLADTAMVPALVSQWREAVLADMAARPLSAEEQWPLRPGDDETIAYGSTLLLAVAAYPWLVLCQIGDGDIVLVSADGQAGLPVPGDPRLDGYRTTSLCQADAADAFRLAVVDLAGLRVGALWLSSDGFGNAQDGDPWPAVGADLVRLAGEHGAAWIREHLPLWVAASASAEGSGDDSAVALLLNQDLAAARPPAKKRRKRRKSATPDGITASLAATSPSAGGHRRRTG